MNKFFIYMGAKTKELSIIKKLLPQFTGKVIEPFAGSAIVSFDLERAAILNDINKDVINLYKVVQNPQMINDLLKNLNYWENIKSHDELQKKYYELRDYLNSKDYSDNLKRAEVYLVIRQLCHRGMQRENNKGEFNVSFGHDRKFQSVLSVQHHEFLKDKVELYNDDFSNIIDKSTKDDWLFLDPPYYNRQDYNGNGFTEEDHKRLANCLKNTKAKWLLIHLDCDLYRELYKDYIIEDEDFTYSMHFGKKIDRTHQKVKHLYIRNYSL